ncbi:MAG: hypothetical protein RR891_05165 [Clostridium sp.]
MKTLIFNGSPRKNGDTKSLIDDFIRNLDGECKIFLQFKVDEDGIKSGL